MAGAATATELDALLAPYAQRAEGCLRRWLVEPGCPDALAEAMRYCVLGGGKRIRPAVVWMSAEAAGGDGGAPADRAAVAVELVHCYSMVHDDLPAMDDDALRRGRPTAHVKFGQAMAILAGDALLTRAFGVLAGAGAELGAALAGELAAGAGAAGMIAGQVADMGLCPVAPGPEGIRAIHAGKTAALVRAAARMGARCAAADEARLRAVGEWAENIGLAYQLVDDLLDVTGTAGQLGKTPGKDAAAGKRNAAAELGAGRLGEMVDGLTARAGAALAPLGPSAEMLRQVGQTLVKRRR